jgi:hypothetical protein
MDLWPLDGYGWRVYIDPTRQEVVVPAAMLYDPSNTEANYTTGIFPGLRDCFRW